MKPHERIILSLDGFTNVQQALWAVKKIGIEGAIVKANDLLDRFGFRAVDLFMEHGLRVFADMKIHEIPTTAARRTARWKDAGAEFLTVHASGRDEMMKACVEAAGDKMKILAVTVLTSFTDSDARHIFGCSAEHMTGNLAYSAFLAGVHGIIASPKDLASEAMPDLKKNGLLPPLVVTPGVRPVWAAKNDQERTATPAEAIRAGADYLVIGRPIFKPPPAVGSPAEAFARITEEIKSAENQPQGPSLR